MEKLKLQAQKDVRDFGHGASMRAVKSSNEERDWLAETPVCRALDQYNIVHTAVMLAGVGF